MNVLGLMAIGWVVTVAISLWMTRKDELAEAKEVLVWFKEEHPNIWNSIFEIYQDPKVIAAVIIIFVDRKRRGK